MANRQPWKESVTDSPRKKSSLTFFDLNNLRFSRVLRTRDCLVQSDRQFIYSLLGYERRRIDSIQSAGPARATIRTGGKDVVVGRLAGSLSTELDVLEVIRCQPSEPAEALRVRRRLEVATDEPDVESDRPREKRILSGEEAGGLHEARDADEGEAGFRGLLDLGEHAGKRDGVVARACNWGKTWGRLVDRCWGPFRHRTESLHAERGWLQSRQQIR